MNYYITDFGAKNDGKTICTAAINTAIDKAAEGGGGYVHVPAGEYVSGSIHLKSNVYLVVETGATLLGSMDINDFDSGPFEGGHTPKAFVQGHDLFNTGILGEGVLDLRRQHIGYTKEHGRPCLLVFANCNKLTVQGVSLINTGFFTIYSFGNENVTFDRLIINSEDCENGDGIDFSGSRNVTISNCKIRTGDDAIGLKTHYPNHPCENFTITNCNLSSTWAGIRIGPETCGDMLNITVSNCTFNNCSDGLKIQLCDNFRMEDLTFSNLNMANVKRPIFMTSNSYPMSGLSGKRRPNPGSYKRIMFSNIDANIIKTPHDWFENHIVVMGLPDGPIEDVMMSNIYCYAVGGGKADDGRGVEVPEFINPCSGYPDVLYDYPAWPSACMYIKNVNRLKLSNCVFETVVPDERPAIVAEAVNGLKLSQIDVMGPTGLLRKYKVDKLSVINCDDEVTELNPEYAKRWDAFRELSLKIEKEIIETCDKLDTLRGKQNDKYAAEVKEEKYFKTTVPAYKGTVILQTPSVSGSPTFKINGNVVRTWTRPDCYGFPICVAVDATNLLTKESNVFEITCERGSVCSDTLLVFAE